MKAILVTGVGGTIGGVGQKVVDQLLANDVRVRAMFRKASAASEHYAKLGVEIVIGDLTDLHDVHRALDGIERMYFGMGVSEKYLEATVNVAAVAKHVGLKAFVNISQMTVSQMSIDETTSSPQQKLHWLSEQVLNWSGLPVVHLRATTFLENPLFNQWTQATVRASDKIVLPFGLGKTSPIAAEDVARAATAILLAPENHLGKVYELTGRASQDMNALARDFSAALGRPVTYVDLPFETWLSKFTEATAGKINAHTVAHIATMAKLHQENRYDRLTSDFKTITGQEPIDVKDWVRANKDFAL